MDYPKLVTDAIPGPKSQTMHARAAEIMKGYSGQVRLFPVVFESGRGVILRDVDGKEYIDFPPATFSG
jgi:4-aminobutyrate aminotransferase-like enzyme